MKLGDRVEFIVHGTIVASDNYGWLVQLDALHKDDEFADVFKFYQVHMPKSYPMLELLSE